MVSLVTGVEETFVEAVEPCDVAALIAGVTFANLSGPLRTAAFFKAFSALDCCRALLQGFLPALQGSETVSGADIAEQS